MLITDCVSAEGSLSPRYSLSNKPFDGARPNSVYRMRCYRTSGYVDESSKSQLRVYFLSKPDFMNPAPTEGETRLEELADRGFLEVTS